MQTGGLWKELQTARSGLPATIRVPRTGSLDTLQPLPTAAFSLLLSHSFSFSLHPLLLHTSSLLNVPTFPQRVCTNLAASAAETRGFAI